jgi:hypothetical protein
MERPRAEVYRRGLWKTHITASRVDRINFMYNLVSHAAMDAFVSLYGWAMERSGGYSLPKHVGPSKDYGILLVLPDFMVMDLVSCS